MTRPISTKPMKSFSMKISQEHEAYLLKLGNGSIVRAIRALVEEKLKNEGRTFVEITHADPFNRTIVRKLHDVDNEGDGPEGTDPLCIADT